MPAPAAILGLGLATPPGTFTQAQATDAARPCSTPPPDKLERFQRLYQRTTVQRRASVLLAADANDDGLAAFYRPDASPTTAQRMAVYQRDAPTLACRAARHALHDASVEPARVTHLVTVSCTGFDAPGVDVHLIHSLGLTPGVTRTHLGFMGCHGAVNALRVAHSYANADPDAVVLVACVELCTLHFQYGWDPGRVIANALFADGAAAAVVAPAPDQPTPSLLGTASAVVPGTADWMAWRVTDHGFAMTLDRRVPDVVRHRLPAFAHDFLARHHLTTADLTGVAVHPGGPKVINAVQAALDLPPAMTQPSRDVLRDHGNMSSPTLLFILQRQPITGPTLALAFGPGLTIEAALFDIA